MNTNRKEEQEDIELLLPWHAAGTLSRRDAARVEQALANDNELARRYDMVRDELNDTIHLNETLGAPSARAMNKLFAMIDAEPARAPKASFNLGAWLGDFVGGFSPRTLAYAGTAAALAILLQAGVLTGMLMQDQGETRLASAPTHESFGTGSFVLVRFNPAASAADITTFLEENKAMVVDGPAPGTGLFRLRVAETLLSGTELSDVVKRMATDKKVVGFTVPSATP